MATANERTLTCRKCGSQYTLKCYSLVSSSDDPELLSKLTSGELFLSECPSCGHKELVNEPFVYHDEAQGAFVAMLPPNIHLELPEGCSGRLVSKVGDLIEKVKILGAGLDDVAVEMCKFVTLQEMGKEVELKFFQFNGADNEIVFTYPENGQMEMLGVGLNVYEDACRILQRNPSIQQSIKGFTTVDQTWLRQFFA